MDRHSEVAHASTPKQGDDGPAPSQEARDSDILKANEFLRTLAANVSRHRVVRHMTHAYYLQFTHAADIRVSRAEIEKEQHQVQETQRRTEMEETPELVQALKTLRDQHARTIVDLGSTRADKRRFESPLNSLNAEHASRNNRLYDFHDVDKGDTQLRCLPAKFWDAFRRCQRVYAECKETEQKIVVAERVRSGGLIQTEELIMNAVCPMNLTNAPREPFAQSFVDSKAPVRNFVCISERLHQLGHVLTNAGDRQYSEEHTLHRIAEDAFIAAGFLAIETRVEEVKLLRRILKNLLDDDLEGKCSRYGEQSPDYYAGQSSEYVSQSPRYGPRSPGYVQSPKAADPPKATPKDIQTELQDILKEHLASQVEYVWNR
jgi:hypothetical protein